MKIYDTGIYDNERADLVGLAYVDFTISQIEEDINWLSQTNEICQSVLGFIDMLLVIAEKFPKDINIKLTKKQINYWKEVFDEWFNRVNKKIPEKYRDSIQNDAHNLFEKLSQYGHSLDWL